MSTKDTSRRTESRIASIIVLAFSVMVCGRAAMAVAQTERVLYSFQGTPDGSYPQAGVVLNSGNIYGTTTAGGVYGHGTVFELRHTSAGFVEKVLYSFTGGSDGGEPIGAVTFDRSVNLYGTAGGGITGCGVIFELTPSSSSGWTESVLYNFSCSSGGGNSDLAFDNQGNLYGVDEGTVFQLKSSGGSWNYTAIANVPGGPGLGKLAIDSEGNLYGATYEGGNSGCAGTCGTVFELSPNGEGWVATALYNFLPSGDGSNPFASVTFSAGKLFGTANLNGAGQGGTVFELQQTKGAWSESTLYAFTNGLDGGFPAADVVVDKVGNLYSTALGGFPYCGSYPAYYDCGVAFEVTPSQGTWTQQVIHYFLPTGADGWWPNGTPTLDSAGNFYNTTYYGGAHGGAFGYGTVYEITP